MNGKVSRNKAKLGGARSPPLHYWSALLVYIYE